MVRFSLKKPTFKLSSIYLGWALGLLSFYLASPVISYLVFWKTLPKFGITLVFGILLVITFGSRLLLLLTGQLTLRSSQHAMGYLLLIWISILQIVWFPTVQAQAGLEDFLTTVAFTFVGAWLAWLGAEALAYLTVKQRSRLIRLILFTTYLSLAFAILHGVVKGYTLYGIFLFAFQNPVSQEVYNYLALADSVSIVALLLFTLSNKTLWQGFLLYTITLLLLLFAYSRASFLGFSLAGLIFLILRYRARYKQKFLWGGLAIVTIALIAYITWLTFFETGGGFIIEKSRLILERISTLFTGRDLSLQGRLELLRQNLPLLEQHWFLGHFMSEVVERGERGAYIHNWLSFWLAYGIGPFLLSLWMIFSLLIKGWRQRQKNYTSLLAFCLLIFVFLQVIIARSYIWPYFWLGLGFAATTLHNNRGELRL